MSFFVVSDSGLLKNNPESDKTKKDMSPEKQP
jgi:hypothetical protein